MASDTVLNTTVFDGAKKVTYSLQCRFQVMERQAQRNIVHVIWIKFKEW